MSNAVTIRDEKAQFTPEQLALIRNTIARNADANELQLFLYRCRIMGLDPLKPGQIHFVKYGSNPGTIVVGIEGFRSLAAKTGKMSGIKRGVLKDEEGNLLGAWCEVYRADWTHPAREEVPFAEYNTGKGPWAKMPETMIKKVAEAAALRMAFPDNLGGIYTQEEMNQAEKESNGIHPEQPAPEDGIQEDGVMIPYGPLAKQMVHRADPLKLRDYVLEIEEKARRLGKPIPSWAKPVIEAAEPIIAEFEASIGKSEEDVPF
jgi:phage recombination protein Bet